MAFLKYQDSLSAHRTVGAEDEVGLAIGAADGTWLGSGVGSGDGEYEGESVGIAGAGVGDGQVSQVSGHASRLVTPSASTYLAAQRELLAATQTQVFVAFFEYQETESRQAAVGSGVEGAGVGAGVAITGAAVGTHPPHEAGQASRLETSSWSTLDASHRELFLATHSHVRSVFFEYLASDSSTRVEECRFGARSTGRLLDARRGSVPRRVMPGHTVGAARVHCRREGSR